MLIVYPNKTSAEWGDELRYSLRSLECYMSDDIELLIIGDIPHWLTGADTLKLNRCGTPEQTTGYYMKVLCDMYDGDFIWINDDIYLLDFCTKQTFETPLVVQNLNDIKRRKTNRWGKLLWNTYDILKHNSLPCLNYESHSPYLFNTKKMKTLAEKYPIFDGLALMATSYYNTYQPEKHMDCGIRLGIYKQGQHVILNSNYKWLNHSNRGFSYNVINFLKNKFNNKSRWEI